jgi:hypothetical protein
VIFIIKTKTMDKFNLQGYLKNNQLLNESIGGYVDMKPLKENPKASIEDDEMDDYEDPLPTIEDVKWFLDAQKFKPKEVMDTEYIATKIYDYYENFAPEFDDEDLDMDEHNMKLAREYQEYYMNKRKGKVKEELGTAMGEEDFGYAKHGGDFGGDDSEFEGDVERIMGLGGDKLLSAAQFLVDDGYELEDVIDFLRANVK